MSAPVLETTQTTEPGLDAALEVFLTHRLRLFRIAYRVTGDASTAEDVVQEAWVRWQRTERTAIKNPAAFLTTATTRLAINVIQSAGHRHETTADSVLAALADPAGDPVSQVEQAAAVAETLRLMMARLTPRELAAYLLRKGFDYAYGDIAALLRTSVPNARQLVHRAQPRFDDDDVELAVDAQEHLRLAHAFLTASRTGDLAALEQVLDRDGVEAVRPSAAAGTRARGHGASRAA